MGGLDGNPDNALVIDSGEGLPCFLILVYWSKDKGTGDPPMVEVRRIERERLKEIVADYESEVQLLNEGDSVHICRGGSK